jgi:hypothetical protein
MDLSSTRLLIAVTGTVAFGFAMGALALAVGGFTGRKAIATGVPAGLVVVAWLLEGMRVVAEPSGGSWVLRASDSRRRKLDQLTAAAADKSL